MTQGVGHETDESFRLTATRPDGTCASGHNLSRGAPWLRESSDRRCGQRTRRGDVLRRWCASRCRSHRATNSQPEPNLDRAAAFIDARHNEAGADASADFCEALHHDEYAARSLVAGVRLGPGLRGDGVAFAIGGARCRRPGAGIPRECSRMACVDDARSATRPCRSGGHASLARRTGSGVVDERVMGARRRT